MADPQANDDSVIDGYQLVAYIATGGTSQVREVSEPGTGRHLAMKLLNPAHPDYKEHKAALKREASVLKTFEHPNIVRYEGFTAGRDHTYLLMEYFRAPNVKLQLKTDRNALLVRFRKLVEGLCAAMQHVHEKGWVHRDIKPDNVLMNKVGEVKLIDFSLASRPQSSLQKLLGKKETTIQGTRTYLAPETIRKLPPVFQTDLYSLGVLLFEVLTGKTPFQGSTPDELLQKHLTAAPPPPSFYNQNLTPEIDRLVLKLLSKKPDQRGKDIGEIAGELRRIKIFKEEPVEKAETEEEESKPDNLLQKLQTAKLDSRLDAKRSELIKQNPELAKQFAEEEKARREAEEAKKRRRIALAQQLDRGPVKGPGSASVPTALPTGGMAAAPYAAAPLPPYGVPAAPYAMPPGGFPPVGYPPGMPAMPVVPPGAVMPGMPVVPPAGVSPVPVTPTIPMTPTVPATPTMPVPPAVPPAAYVPASAVRPGVPPAPVPVMPPGSAPHPPAASGPVGPSPGMAAGVPNPKATTTPPPSAPPATPSPPPSDDDLEYMTELPEVL